MNKKIYFDDSLPIFAKFVSEELGVAALENNYFLRDAEGRLSVIVLDDKIDKKNRTRLSTKAKNYLGDYVDDNDFVFSTPDELFDESLKDIGIASKIALSSSFYSGNVFLFERRIIGSDWLKKTKQETNNPVRIVFSSIKGGVGRSTALCVVASALAQEGKRVLAIDMDLEAPGLGNMLLTEKTLPKYGLLDFFVEKNVSKVNGSSYIDMVSSSWISSGKGRVDVIPALGESSFNNPENVLGKIARSYLSTTDCAGNNFSFIDYMDILVDKFSDPTRYDVILIDARSGLHETTASAMVGLGANIFCFGVDQPQTFAGYDLLFSHLSIFNNIDPSWLNRFNFVQAKASDGQDKRDLFAQKMEAKIASYFSKKEADVDINVASLKDTFEVEWDDTESVELITEEIDVINPIISILDDSRFSDFDPISNRDILTSNFYDVTFKLLLERVRSILEESLEGEEI
ncbi:AAA family ATPase [Serratia marcescens]|uniref:KGGVGR-motif variant AAA ATPase n=1 Tax=Serratia marcescens TaxID=615 RepID=UPI003204AAB9